MPHKTGNYSKTGKQETFSVALSHCFLTREFQNCATKNSADMPDSDPSFNKSAYFSDMKKAVFTPINVNTAFSQHLKIRIFNWWRRCVTFCFCVFLRFPKCDTTQNRGFRDIKIYRNMKLVIFASPLMISVFNFQ